jgi:hypothetical protein
MTFVIFVVKMNSEGCIKIKGKTAMLCVMHIQSRRQKQQLKVHAKKKKTKKKAKKKTKKKSQRKKKWKNRRNDKYYTLTFGER